MSRQIRLFTIYVFLAVDTIVFTQQPAQKSRNAQGVPANNDLDDYVVFTLARVSQYFSTPKEMVSEETLKKWGPKLPHVVVELVFPEKKKLEMERELKHGKFYCTYIPEKTFESLRKGMRLILLNHLKLAKEMHGKYILTPSSFDGDPVIAKEPYFPTRYRVDFIPSGFPVNKAIFLFEISITGDIKADESNDTVGGYLDKIAEAIKEK